MQIDRLLTPDEAAGLLNMRPATLARWRWAGVGPRYAKIGGAIRYDPSDLATWIDARRRESRSVSNANPDKGMR